MRKTFILSAVCATLASSVVTNQACVYAQDGSPVPGSNWTTQSAPPTQPNVSAPLPGSELTNPNLNPGQAYAQPMVAPPQATTSHTRSAYGQLPLTVSDAKTRLAELRNALAVSRTPELQTHIYHLCEWLADSADAHNKMANSFAKHDSTKLQSIAERQAGSKFAQLKYDALLLKADLLIAQKRYPEALGPLVDIVLAEPESATGQTAYKRLKDLGFSQEVDPSMTMAAPVAQGNAVVAAKPKSPAPPSAQSKKSMRTRTAVQR